MIVVMLGPAGCGKMSLTAAFGAYLERLGQDVAYVNLDPGREELPYEPDFDIRAYFTVAQIMREKKLEPNGAMIRASELLEAHLDDVLEAIRPTAAVFMMDPITADSFASLVVAKLLALSVQLRLEVPTVLVLNKADLLTDEALSRALENPEALRARIEAEEGLTADMALTCLEALEAFSQVAKLVKVSAKTSEGMDALFDLVHEAFCTCGDLS